MEIHIIENNTLINEKDIKLGIHESEMCHNCRIPTRTCLRKDANDFLFINTMLRLKVGLHPFVRVPNYLKLHVQSQIKFLVLVTDVEPCR